MTTSDSTWPRHTERLTLRPAEPADIDRMLSYRSHPDVTRWMLNTLVDPDAYRTSWLSDADPFDYSAVAVHRGVVIGTGSLEVVDAMGQVHVADGPWRRAEGRIGYIIDPAYAGRGFATELGTALLDLAFAELGVHRVTAGCFADNLASVRVLEKLGMRREQHGIQDSWHAELGWIDGYTYGILAQEWDARRSG